MPVRINVCTINMSLKDKKVSKQCNVQYGLRFTICLVDNEKHCLRSIYSDIKLKVNVLLTK